MWLEAKPSNEKWKQVTQSMTGHKSNSNLNPLINLKEVSFPKEMETRRKVRETLGFVPRRRFSFMCMG